MKLKIIFVILILCVGISCKKKIFVDEYSKRIEGTWTEIKRLWTTGDTLVLNPDSMCVSKFYFDLNGHHTYYQCGSFYGTADYVIEKSDDGRYTIDYSNSDPPAAGPPFYINFFADDSLLIYRNASDTAVWAK